MYDTIESFFEWLQSTGYAVYVQRTFWAFPTIESVHVLAVVLVVGTIAIVDLRILGVPSTRRPFTEIASDTLRITWICFAIAVISGLMLFASKAVEYSLNFAFQMKMILLVLAGINMLVFELIIVRTVKHWDQNLPVPLAGRISGTLSLAFWIGVIAMGRWIGFATPALPF